MHPGISEMKPSQEVMMMVRHGMDGHHHVVDVNPPDKLQCLECLASHGADYIDFVDLVLDGGPESLWRTQASKAIVIFSYYTAPTELLVGHKLRTTTLDLR